MEVRVIHKSGTNQAEVQVYDGPNLVATLEVYEAFGKTEVKTTTPSGFVVSTNG